MCHKFSLADLSISINVCLSARELILQYVRPGACCRPYESCLENFTFARETCERIVCENIVIERSMCQSVMRRDIYVL